jgi:hypothetical protein
MHTTATIHAHPAVASPFFIFEVRRLAIHGGCTFVPSKPKLATRSAPPPLNPNDGGRAA